ncbi:Uncharacterised protein [Mycobacteroides abscessus subsp. abscessus]|uniref:major capsid protein n=1 Tax=Mycobacteroides abscessus TaxID=36809 RepID=UPI0009279EF9|nr:major capsid protein [Mycobacteroides abscessus]MDO3315712.1 hypothetical protein [Mycobacteroides abscessus subsp. abscessus]MDO3343107.1 hypothetical protein [Mycobacteroides abscessus subsp. abscessus]SHP28965.1 Uncharacterised protein [Mycobacteroides abscessus subsp. abscessus]SHP45867.1 Uncharacterised protein [Mycobacteroides abscessus subsp. abscessus]SHP49605.1 Uncharacterised protein [Mycobacteroides abscessus subsp. abscessus]
MTSPLLPALTDRSLTVDVALKQPSILRDRIAKLADDQILLPNFFRPFGTQLQGGGLLYSVVQASDFFTSDVEKRAPGAEYKIVEGVDPDPKLAVVEDWGGKFQVTAEQIRRNDVNYLDQQTTQLVNTIVRKLDVRTVEELQASSIVSVAASGSWNGLTFVGPEANLTPSAQRPTAHFAQLQERADLEELGVVHDLLVVHPTQARQLREAYADTLEAALKSAGLRMVSNPRIPAGIAYACQKGQVGTIGFEAPLTVDIWEDKATRSTWVQAYVVPAFAVDRPYAAKKLAGLN